MNDSVDSADALLPPMDSVFVVRRESDARPRLYHALSQARARVSSTKSTADDRFAEGVTLWSVGEEGWSLLFAAAAGDELSSIDWSNAAVGRREREERRRALREARKLEAKRREYEELKSLFGDDQ